MFGLWRRRRLRWHSWRWSAHVLRCRHVLHLERAAPRGRVPHGLLPEPTAVRSRPWPPHRRGLGRARVAGYDLAELHGGVRQRDAFASGRGEVGVAHHLLQPDGLDQVGTAVAKRVGAAAQPRRHASTGVRAASKENQGTKVGRSSGRGGVKILPACWGVSLNRTCVAESAKGCLRP